MGLIVWLPLNGNLNNQGIGEATITNDGATVDNNGKIGKCYSFNNTRIQIQSNALKNMFQSPSSVFSFATWVYLNSDETDRVIIFGNWNNSPFVNWELSAGHYQVLAAGLTNSYPSKMSGTMIAQNVWTHLAVTYDGENVRFYVNGDLKDTQACVTNISTPMTSNTFWIGSDSRSDATRLKGKMNDFRVYNHVLSPKEVKEISKGLAVHYTLSGGAQNNLISGTMDIPTTNSVWWYGSRATKSGTVGDFSQIVLTGSTADWSACVRCTPIRYKLLRNFQVTFSMYAKATASCTATLEWSISHKGTPYARAKYVTVPIVVGTEWKRYTVTHTITDSYFLWDGVSGTTETVVPDTDFMYLCLYNHVDNTTLYTYGWKLEYGSVATPWKPHPNDSQYMAMGQFTGNRNLLLDSRKNAGVNKSTYDIGDYNLSESLVEGKTYTISAKVNSSGKQSYAFYLSGGSIGLDPAWHLIGNTDGYCVGIFTATNQQATNTAGSGHGFVRVYMSNNVNAYQGSTALTGTANVEWIKLEENNLATGWVPHVQDSGYADKMFEYDVSGFGYNAIRYGSMKIDSNTAKYVTSTMFGGVAQDYIQMPQATYRNIIGSTEAVTASIWARRSSWTTPSTIQMFFSCQEGGGFIVRMNSNGNFDFAVGTGTSSNTYKSSVGSKTIPNYGFAANSWHMFTITYDGLVLKFYIDGVLDKTVSAYSTKTPIFYQTNTMLFLGAEAGWNTIDAAYMFTGNLSDFRWYATALSADDILELYQTSASVANNGALLASEFVE